MVCWNAIIVIFCALDIKVNKISLSNGKTQFFLNAFGKQEKVHLASKL